MKEELKLIEIEHKFKFKINNKIAQEVEDTLNSIHTACVLLSYNIAITYSNSSYATIVIERQKEKNIYINLTKSNIGKLRSINVRLEEDVIYRSNHNNHTSHLKALQKIREII